MDYLQTLLFGCILPLTIDAFQCTYVVDRGHVQGSHAAVDLIQHDQRWEIHHLDNGKNTPPAHVSVDVEDRRLDVCCSCRGDIPTQAADSTGGSASKWSGTPRYWYSTREPWDLRSETACRRHTLSNCDSSPISTSIVRERSSSARREFRTRVSHRLASLRNDNITLPQHTLPVCAQWAAS